MSEYDEQIITPDDVFDFMSVANDQRDTHWDNVNALIVENQREMKRIMGRQILSQTLSASVIHRGQHFEFSNDFQRILFKGDYLDLYSITAVTEEGTALTESTTYNDSGAWRFDSIRKMLVRLDGTWSTADFAIKITGSYGYVESDGATREDLKNILKEMVAMQSGLWKKTFISEGGDVSTQKDTPGVWFRNKLRGHRNTSLL